MFYFSVADHAKERQDPFVVCIVDTAFLRQVCHVDTIGGHTTDALIRVGAGLIFHTLTGVAQRAAAVAQAEAI